MRYFVGDNNINGEHEFSDGNELIESLVLSKIENEDIPSISINHNEIRYVLKISKSSLFSTCNFSFYV